MIGCIYKMTSPSGRIYIGQTQNLTRRIKDYQKLKCKTQRKIYYSLKKYGFDAHDFHVIDYCHVSLMNNRERYYQDMFDVIGDRGLNLVLTTSDTRSGKLSKETLAKLSASHMGKHNHDERVRKLISQAHKGKVIPQWHKDINSAKMKIARKGTGNTFYGKKHKPELVAAISARTTGGNNPKAKTVLNIETGIFYETLTEFAKHIGFSNPTAIIKFKTGLYPQYMFV